MLKTILNYLSQSSTYNGLIAILTSFGIVLKPELTQAIVALALAAAGLVKVFIEGSDMEIKAQADDKAKAGV